MAGIVMDTATFAHPNATPRTLAVSAALVEAGAPLSDISRRLYRTKPDAQLRLFGLVLDRLERADERPRDLSSCCPTRTSPRPARCGAHSEGIIDLLAQSETAEVAILFKEAGAATRISVRTKPGGVDATVLTGRVRRRRARPRGRRNGRGPARPGTRPGPRGRGSARGAVVARPPERRPGASSTRRAGHATASSSSPSPPGPTSHDVVALVRRLAATKRVGHGGTLDPFASRRAAALPRCARPGSSSTTWATTRPTARRSASARPRRPTTLTAS